MMQLQAVHGENYAIRREVVTRAARIDALSVDRSRFTNMPLWRWSADAARFEPALQAYRASITETDRRRAWKALFAMTAQ